VGWADRLAVLLADRRPEGDFKYTNLAVRGKLLDQIVADQVPQALDMAPALITFCAGGNDIIRPGTDPDEVAERFERSVSRLAEAAGTVLVTTGFDTRGVPVLKHLRGKIATYNGHVRAIADRYGCPAAVRGPATALLRAQRLTVQPQFPGQCLVDPLLGTRT
jgi:lysophospholipase L1-like esterase